MRGGLKVVRARSSRSWCCCLSCRIRPGRTDAGTVRDTSGGVMPGVTVEVTSPALIEKVRIDDHRQQRAVPHHEPARRHLLGDVHAEGFTTQQHDNVVLTPASPPRSMPTMAVGALAETVKVVSGETPTVDVQNARQATTFAGEEIRELPTARNISSLLTLTPGAQQHRAGQGSAAPGMCVGGVGVCCNPSSTASTWAHAAADGNLADDLPGPRHGGRQSSTPAARCRIIGGMTGGYIADIANAQEVNIQISGALGESETGGASINIVPRTGGNRFAGNYFTTYTRGNWFDEQRGPSGATPCHQRLLRSRRSAQATTTRRRLRRPDQARPAVVLRAGRAREAEAAGRRQTSGRT